MTLLIKPKKRLPSSEIELFMEIDMKIREYFI